MEEFITDKWNDLLSCFPAALKDIYFEESYVKLYEDNRNKGMCYVYREADSLLLFPFLRREFEYQGQKFYDFETAYGYGGPITSTTDAFFAARAFAALKHYFAQEKYIAGFVRFHPLLDNQSIFTDESAKIQDRQTIAIDLTLSEQNIWMNEIHTKNRNVIKKGIKSGLSFVVDEQYRDLDKFVELYSATMNKLSADEFYFFSDDYYKNLATNLSESFLGLVMCEGKIISGAIFFYSEQYGHYHLSGSDVNYLSLCPNNFMLYSAALELKKRGVRKFHLGGGGSESEADTLFCFKERFSKSRYWFDIGKLIFNRAVYDAVCGEWIAKYPEKQDKYKKMLLKYKY